MRTLSSFLKLKRFRIAAILALILGSILTAYAVHNNGFFELDANTANNGVALDDADDVYIKDEVDSTHPLAAFDYAFVFDNESAEFGDESVWGEKSADTKALESGGAGCTTKTNLGGKFDFVHGFQASYELPDPGDATPVDTLIIVGGDRKDVEGSTSIAITLLQEKVNCVPQDLGGTGKWTGNRTPGDWHIASDFTGGGFVTNVEARQYMAGSGGKVELNRDPDYVGGDCTSDDPHAINKDLCMTVNGPRGGADGTIYPEWFNPDALESGKYFEAGINITELFEGIGAPEACFNTVIIESRASFSLGSRLHDYMIIPINTCGKVTVVKEVTGPSFRNLTGSFDFDFLKEGEVTPREEFTLNTTDTVTTVTSDDIIDVFPGNYRVEETLAAPWVPFAEAACVDQDDNPVVDAGTPNTGTKAYFPVGRGDHITCTFINENPAAPGNIIIEKVTEGGQDTFAFAQDIDLSTLALTTTAAGIGGKDSQNFLLVDPGEYEVEELLGSLPDGWEFNYAECTDGFEPEGFPVTSVTGATASIAVTDGETITCTFYNRKLPTLKLVKSVINDDGGTAVADNWTLSAAAVADNSRDFSNTGGSGAFEIVLADVYYDLSESTIPGYAAGDWSCDVGTQDGSSISLDYGENATCTIINDDIPPTLKLVKTVTNDDGGNNVPDDWTLSAAATGNNSRDFSNAGDSGIFETIFANDGYNLSESAVAGYTAGSWSCDGGLLVGSTVTLGLDDDVTCTINNDDIAPTLRLVKTVTNDDGGNNVPDDWTLSAAAAAPDDGRNFSNDGGSGGFETVFSNAGYDLSESAVSGYTPGDWSCDGGDLVGTVVTLDEGETGITCTINNDDIPPTLKLVKTVTNDDGGNNVPDDWTLSAAAAAPDDGRNFSNDGGSGGFETVFSNAGYDLSESAVSGYTPGDWSCDGGDLVGSTVTLTEGETGVTCTINNDDIAPTLRLVKTVINDNGGTAVANDWTLFAAADAPDDGRNFDNAGGSGVFTTVYANAGYDLSESIVAGYSLTSLSCDGGTFASSTVTLGLAEDVTCTFVNDDISPRLKVTKVLLPPDSAGLFNLLIDNIIEAANQGDGGTTGFVDVNAGTHYVSETAGTDTMLSDYDAVISGDCDAAGEVVLALAEDKACIITNTFIPGEEGCTPGFWKNSTGSWQVYDETTLLKDVFIIPPVYDGDVIDLDLDTLMTALNYGGGDSLQEKAQILLRAGVAALLNAANNGVDYTQSTAMVRATVNAALEEAADLYDSGNKHKMDLALALLVEVAGELDADNNLGCPLANDNSF